MMENKGCITCRKCEQVRSNFFCGRTRLSQKQLYNKHGFCSDYEPKEQIEKPMTNEEWFDDLSTEEKAEFLSKIEEQYPCGSLLKCDVTCGYHSQCRNDDVAPTNKEAWVEWLKQPHTPRQGVTK